MARREVNAAIADYNEAIRLDPTGGVGSPWLYERRADRAVADCDELIS